MAARSAAATPFTPSSMYSTRSYAAIGAKNASASKTLLSRKTTRSASTARPRLETAASFVAETYLATDYAVCTPKSGNQYLHRNGKGDSPQGISTDHAMQLVDLGVFEHVLVLADALAPERGVQTHDAPDFTREPPPNVPQWRRDDPY
ncbi:hypothetical protein ON010_g9505 [Phytophthora cinnamomi]|nr:hypothetical protein ON010_g9505 [Phytophthora cinnamomi]